jgi:recombination protein RecA
MSNLVGSLEIPKMLFARRNVFLSMFERQKEILVGCILGDAHITPMGKIRIEQSEKQQEYVEWKYEELDSLCYPSKPRSVIHVLHGVKEYKSLFFDLRQYFRPWRYIFYKEKQKIFPKNLFLTPLSLAVWYMDDGCWTGKKCIISIESFKGESCNNIQEMFQKHYGIETVIGVNGKLTIRKKSHKIFYELIAPYIIPSMEYKIPNPVTTGSLNQS